MGRSRKSHGKRSGKGTSARPAAPASPPVSNAGSRGLWWLPLGVAVLVLVILGIWWLRVPAPGVATTPVASVATAASPPAPALPPAHYVGTQACASCHAKQTQAWQSSHHALAMQEANAQTIEGHFDGALKQDGSVASFSRRGNAYVVKTDGPDGKPAEYDVKYTFGVYPLQQYLVEFPDGRLQALRASWDARPAAEGGQRWFNLYPDEHIDAHDTLHWTRLNQNWNYMCADCHSTNLRKNYDLAKDSYATTWSAGWQSPSRPGRRQRSRPPTAAASSATPPR